MWQKIIKNRKLSIPLVAILLAGILFGGYYWYSNSQWRKAENYYRQGEYNKAEQVLEYLPMPQSSERLAMYGRIMQAVSNLDEAEQAYQRIVDKNSDQFSQLMLGNVYTQKGEHDKAIKSYRDLLDSNPNYVQAYINLASIYNTQGQVSKAIDVLQEGAENNSNASNIYSFMLSIANKDQNPQEYEMAYQKLKELDPENIMLKE